MSALIAARPGFDIYSCNGTRLMADGLSEPFLSGSAYSRETSWTLDDIIIVNHIYGTAVVRRDLWERVGGFTTGLRYAEDYDFWLRALALGARQIYTPQRLAVYMERVGGKSKQRMAHAETQIGIITRLASMPELNDAQRELCAKKLELHPHADRARGARGTPAARASTPVRAGEYLGVRSAYNSQAMYAAGLALMLVSPRLYARVFRTRDARRKAS